MAKGDGRLLATFQAAFVPQFSFTGLETLCFVRMGFQPICLKKIGGVLLPTYRKNQPSPTITVFLSIR